jgi:periodic tryptophan protein 1
MEDENDDEHVLPTDNLIATVVGSDGEALRWDPWENYGFYVCLILPFSIHKHLTFFSLENLNGIVLNFIVQTLPSNLDNPSPSRFTLSVHDGADHPIIHTSIHI